MASENAVNNNGQLRLIRTISLITGLCVLFVSWGITVGTLWTKVNSNTEIAKLVLQHEVVVNVMQRDIEDIKVGVDRLLLASTGCEDSSRSRVDGKR